MFSGFSDLEVPALGKVLRRTIICSLAVGVGAIIVALCLGSPLAAIGLALGLALAIINLRFLDSGVAKVETTGETDTKAVRRALGSKTVTRLAIITAIAIGLMLINGPLGIGTVVGLVIFQIFFVINVGRAVITAGVA